ncbi:MAG: ATP-binding protein [Oligoflexia bacterium]|nr:ATP-binding protein [Oligoflexia bacterium]
MKTMTRFERLCIRSLPIHLSREAYRQQLLSVQIAWTFMGLGLLYAFYLLAVGLQLAALLVALAALSLWGAIRLISGGHPRSGRAFLISMSYAAIFLVASYLGAEGRIQHFLYVLVLISILVFSRKESRLLAFFVSLSLVIHYFLHLTGYQPIPWPARPDLAVVHLAGIASLLVTFLAIFIVAFHIKNLCDHSQGELDSERDFTSRVLTGIGDALFTLDDSLTILNANPASSRIFGHPEAYFHGKKLTQLLGPDALMPGLSTLSAKRADGTPLHLSLYLSEIQHSERKRLVAVVRDHTQERAAELELELQRGKAIASARVTALGEMAGSIAHEINTPLATITLYTGLLKDIAETTPLPARERISKSVEVLSSTVTQIARIINSLRRFAREDDEEPFASTTARQLIEETLTLCRQRFKNHQVQLRVIEPLVETRIVCNPIQLEQALLNLLNNALEAAGSAQEKWVSIATRLIEISEREHLEIAVTDSGAGIPEPLGAKLFQPFFTTKPPGKGTGLGLSSSYGILLRHGGELLLDSQAPHTRFVMRVPLSQGPYPEPL